MNIFIEQSHFEQRTIQFPMILYSFLSDETKMRIHITFVYILTPISDMHFLESISKIKTLHDA